MLKHIVAFVPDLMDRSKLSTVDADVRFAATVDAFVDLAARPGVDVAVIDLSRPGAVDAIRRLPEGLRCIAFGSHVDRDVLQAASEAGCGTVLPRSKFFGDLPDLFA